MNAATLPTVYALGGVALAGIGLVPLLEHQPTVDSWFSVQWPRELADESVTSLLRHFAASRRPRVLCFEVRAHRGKLEYQVGVPAADAERLPPVFASFLSGVLLEPLPHRSGQSLRYAIRLKLETRERALRTDAAEEIARSLITGLAATGRETVVVQWLLGHRLAPMYVSSDITGLPSTPQWLWRSVMGQNEPLDARAQTELRRKVSDHGFRAMLRIGVDVPERKVAHHVLRRMVGSLRVAEGPDAGLSVRPVDANLISRAKAPRFWPRAAWSVSELAGLLAWPIGDATLPGVERVASRRLPPSALVPSAGRIVVDGNEPLHRRPLGQDVRDALLGTHVIGPTGVGKSTLLANLIIQDIAAGRGVIAIDPKGDLIADVIARIPADQVDRVVIFDPADQAPIGLNPLHGAGRSGELVADQLIAVFRGLYGDYLGPRTIDVLASAIQTLAGRPEATLSALPLLLGNERYRRQLTRGLTDELALKPFWVWFERLSEAERNVVVAPVMNKVRPFLMREGLRAVISQAVPRFKVAEVFTKRKVLLVSLAKGVIGTEAAGLLGSLIVSQTWQAAQRRAGIPPARRHPVVCYIDEFQDYLHLPTDLADVLATTRGLGMALVASHQHLAQLTPSVRAAVLVNARSRVCFRLGAEDAAVMARTTELLDAHDFQSLGKYEVYALLVADGQATPFASGATRPLPAVTSDPKEIRAASRQRYGRPRKEIDDELTALLSLGSVGEVDSVIGKKPRRPR
jgi:hypothetical protein